MEWMCGMENRNRTSVRFRFSKNRGFGLVLVSVRFLLEATIRFGHISAMSLNINPATDIYIFYTKGRFSRFIGLKP